MFSMFQRHWIPVTTTITPTKIKSSPIWTDLPLELKSFRVGFLALSWPRILNWKDSPGSGGTLNLQRLNLNPSLGAVENVTLAPPLPPVTFPCHFFSCFLIPVSTSALTEASARLPAFCWAFFFPPISLTKETFFPGPCNLSFRVQTWQYKRCQETLWNAQNLSMLKSAVTAERRYLRTSQAQMLKLSEGLDFYCHLLLK